MMLLGSTVDNVNPLVLDTHSTVTVEGESLLTPHTATQTRVRSLSLTHTHTHTHTAGKEGEGEAIKHTDTRRVRPGWTSDCKTRQRASFAFKRSCGSVQQLLNSEAS